jgi:AmiR/NasT family two-component response regulator
LSSDVQNIIELLGPREVIGQAIALLMARDQVSRDAAFAMLVRESSLSRRTVREVTAAMAGQVGD